MRKYFVMMMAVCAIGFTSCGNKNAQAPAEETEAATSLDLSSVTSDLAAQLEAGDAAKFQEALATVQAKVADLLQNNPEQAKQYLETIQNYLKENTEKITKLVGDNQIVNTTISTLVETPADNILDNLKSVVGNAGDSVSAAANATVDAAKQAVQDKKEDVEQAIQNKKEEVEQAVENKKEEVKQAAANKVNEAADKVNDKVNEGAQKLLKGAGLK